MKKANNQNSKLYYVAHDSGNHIGKQLSPSFSNAQDAKNWQSAYQGIEKTYCVALEAL
ncbi:MAG: hypothetical protein U9R28_11805 [Pseudomonadota bacterium]|nr:hypothetical protein [Pseudomonadota bacterium]